MSLASDLRRIAANKKSDMEKIVRASAFQLGAEVVPMTPVKEGRLINNWNSSIGSIDDSTSDDTSKSGSASLSKLESKISSIDMGATFNFSNSMPYAARIEYDGWSEIAKDGIVRVAVLRWDSIVQHEVSKYK